jgi:polyisoprenoid-binding protein YceI
VSTITQTKESLPTGTWQVDPVHSQIGFAVDYVVGTFRGSFSPIEAALDVSEDGTATLAGSVPVAGVKVQDENLTAHLKSPEFFDLERAPEITLSTTEIQRTGDQITVVGDLGIKGITHQIEAHGTITDPADDAFGGVRFGLSLETTIDRTRFGINWNNPLPNGEPSLANDVTLTADLNLVKA